MTDKNLLDKARLLASNYLKLESELLSVISEIDKRKSFRKLGYASLYEFVTDELKLTSAQAYSFISVARKAHSVPELKTEVANGLSIYKAQRLTTVLTGANKKEWFDLAKNSTQRQLEREVAIASPKTAVVDKSTYLPLDTVEPDKVTIPTSNPRLRMQLGVSEKFMLKFRRAQDLVSQKQKSNASYEDTFEAALDALLAKIDPVKKAERQRIRGKLTQPLNNLSSDASEHRELNRKFDSSHANNFDGNSNSSATGSKSLETAKLYAKDSFELGKYNGECESKKIRKQTYRDSPSNPNIEGRQIIVCNENDLIVSGDTINASFTEQKEISEIAVGPDKNSARAELGGHKLRKPIPAHVIHQVQLRDEGRCTHMNSSGKRCSQRRYLEVHHILPVAHGGSDELNNLTMLCSGHHNVVHAGVSVADPNERELLSVGGRERALLR